MSVTSAVLVAVDSPTRLANPSRPLRVLQVIASVADVNGGATTAMWATLKALQNRNVYSELATTNEDGPHRLLNVPTSEFIQHGDHRVRFFPFQGRPLHHLLDPGAMVVCARARLRSRPYSRALQVCSRRSRSYRACPGRALRADPAQHPGTVGNESPASTAEEIIDRVGRGQGDRPGGQSSSVQLRRAIPGQPGPGPSESGRGFFH